MSADCESHNVRGVNNKAVVHIKVAGALEPLLITCTSIEIAESIADLIDRYCRLVNGTNLSLWNKRGKTFLIFPLFRVAYNAINLSVLTIQQASQMTYYGCPCYHGNILLLRTKLCYICFNWLPSTFDLNLISTPFPFVRSSQSFATRVASQYEQFKKRQQKLQSSSNGREKPSRWWRG